MNLIRRILPHALMILAALFLVLLVLNEFNPYMGFLSSDVSKLFLLAFCAVALANGVVAVIRDRREG